MIADGVTGSRSLELIANGWPVGVALGSPFEASASIDYSQII